VPDKGDRFARGAPDRSLIDRCEDRAAIGLADHARMSRAVEFHVMDEDRLSEHLCRLIESRRVAADDGFARRSSSRVGCQNHRWSERPIIVRGGFAVA
jgi:hypothetical protein